MTDDADKIIDMLLSGAAKAGADASDAVVIKSSSHGCSVRLGTLESIERSDDSTIGLRVFIGARNATVSMSSHDENDIPAVIQRAIAMAKIAPEDSYAGIAEPGLLAQDIPDLDLFDDTSKSSEELRELALKAEDAARAVDGISNSDGGHASHSLAEVTLATSNGFLGRYRRSGFGVSVVVLAEKDGRMERDYDFASSVWFEDLPDATEIGTKAATRTLARLGAKRAKTGTFPVIYDNRISASIAGHIASAINGAAVARGTSFLKDKLNEVIAANSVTMTDNPLLKRGLGSSPFDGEGLPRKSRIMINKGKLESWFLDLASARQLALTPQGNARRSGVSPPAPAPCNWIMESGVASREDLISEIKDGFLITEMIGSSVNLITGDYSRGASGFWIEDGAVTFPVTEATIAGNLVEMLKEITPADDPDLSKSTITPSLRVDGMTVAGG